MSFWPRRRNKKYLSAWPVLSFTTNDSSRSSIDQGSGRGKGTAYQACLISIYWARYPALVHFKQHNSSLRLFKRRPHLPPRLRPHQQIACPMQHQSALMLDDLI